MTNIDDVINQKINNAGAMALAKGDEMTICIHDWDFTPDNDLAIFMCLKCGEKLDVVDAMNRLNMLEDDVARLRKEGDEYRAQLASRDALIERLVEAGAILGGEEKSDDVKTYRHGVGNLMHVVKPKKNVWRALVAEWKASKDGGGE